MMWRWVQMQHTPPAAGNISTVRVHTPVHLASRNIPCTFKHHVPLWTAHRRTHRYLRIHRCCSILTVTNRRCWRSARKLQTGSRLWKWDDIWLSGSVYIWAWRAVRVSGLGIKRTNWLRKTSSVLGSRTVTAVLITVRESKEQIR